MHVFGASCSVRLHLFQCRLKIAWRRRSERRSEGQKRKHIARVTKIIIKKKVKEPSENVIFSPRRLCDIMVTLGRMDNLVRQALGTNNISKGLRERGW